MTRSAFKKILLRFVELGAFEMTSDCADVQYYHLRPGFLIRARVEDANRTEQWITEIHIDPAAPLKMHVYTADKRYFLGEHFYQVELFRKVD